MLKLYTIFHLNIAYSSIEEDQRLETIQCCYWPLLNLARDHGIPIGIEASGYTLETIFSLDPKWVEELRLLISEGSCEFIGSGYSQIIGPLVPGKVNEANLLLGNQTYQKLLDFQPSVALVNEQAFSCGLIQHYISTGYRAIIMDWDNPYSYHSNWEKQLQYFPQFACDQKGNQIELIWNHSISFQKFQRFAHGEINLEEYLQYLSLHSNKEETKYFSLYGGDAEVFDYRPGRYQTEAPLNTDGEWFRIKELFIKLKNSNQFKIITPSEVLIKNKSRFAYNKLQLETPETPIPVKKQNKYNITRWALTGQNDLEANTLCWRIYNNIKDSRSKNTESWKKLCYLWSSDFRTHITDTRWSNFHSELLEHYNSLGVAIEPFEEQNHNNKSKAHTTSEQSYTLEEDSRHNLIITSASIILTLNPRKGLAIESLIFKDLCDKPLIGTIPHGYYDNISMGADFFSGHMILEMPGSPKITDLSYIKPQLTHCKDYLFVSAPIITPLGKINKTLQISLNKALIEIKYQFAFDTSFFGSMKVGNITLLPESFDPSSLYFSSCNGGYDQEFFYLNGSSTNHSEPVSFLVSSKNGLGLTDGNLYLGDNKKSLKVFVDKTSSALMGQIQYNNFDHTFFLRAMLSAREMDETSKPTTMNLKSSVNTVQYSISALQS